MSELLPIDTKVNLLPIGTKVNLHSTEIDDDRRLREAKFGTIVGYWKDDPHTPVTYPYYVNLLDDEGNVLSRRVMLSKSAVSPIRDIKITIRRKELSK